MIRALVLLPFILLFFRCDVSAVRISKTDQVILEKFFRYAREKKLADLPVSERIPYVATFFIGTPYKGNTLNVTKEELPVINLHELDCVTFVENVLALSFLQEYALEYRDVFVQNIVKVRYRHAQIEDYTSRLHYSSDWLYEMQRQHFLTDLTRFAGGIAYAPQVSFMTKHYDCYPPLKRDPELRSKMKEVESAINRRTYYYIPKERIEEAYAKIKAGDIVLITTTIKGLDTSHLGFAMKRDGSTYLLHASSVGGKVMFSEQPLKEYMEGISTQSGIMLARAAKVIPDEGK